MRSYNVSAQLDLSVLIKDQINKIQKHIHGSMKDKIAEGLEYAREKMVEYAPEKTGDLRRKILSIPLHIKNDVGFDLITGKTGYFRATLNLSGRKYQKVMWVNNGTGIYGPSGVPILPKKSKFLIFKIGDRWIKTRFVLGQKGQHFIERGINSSKVVMVSKIRSAVKGS